MATSSALTKAKVWVSKVFEPPSPREVLSIVATSLGVTWLSVTTVLRGWWDTLPVWRQVQGEFILTLTLVLVGHAVWGHVKKRRFNAVWPVAIGPGLGSVGERVINLRVFRRAGGSEKVKIEVLFGGAGMWAVAVPYTLPWSDGDPAEFRPLAKGSFQVATYARFQLDGPLVNTNGVWRLTVWYAVAGKQEFGMHHPFQEKENGTMVASGLARVVAVSESSGATERHTMRFEATDYANEDPRRVELQVVVEEGDTGRKLRASRVLYHDGLPALHEVWPT